MRGCYGPIRPAKSQSQNVPNRAVQRPLSCFPVSLPHQILFTGNIVPWLQGTDQIYQLSLNGDIDVPLFRLSEFFHLDSPESGTSMGKQPAPGPAHWVCRSGVCSHRGSHFHSRSQSRNHGTHSIEPGMNLCLGLSTLPHDEKRSRI